MDVNVSIGGGQKMALTGAVLVYRGGTDAFAVWHPAKPGPGGGAPYLGEDVYKRQDKGKTHCIHEALESLPRTLGGLPLFFLRSRHCNRKSNRPKSRS